MKRAEHHTRPHYNSYQAQQQQYYAHQYNQPQDSHSVILVTAGYDHTIRFWEALSGICSRTIQHPDSVNFHYYSLIYKNANIKIDIF